MKGTLWGYPSVHGKGRLGSPGRGGGWACPEVVAIATSANAAVRIGLRIGAVLRGAEWSLGHAEQTNGVGVGPPGPAAFALDRHRQERDCTRTQRSVGS